MKPTLTARDLVYRGAYRLGNKDGLGNTAGLTYAASRGTWFTVGVRQKQFALLEFAMPDDATCLPGPVEPSTPLAGAPAAALVKRWGTFLADTIDATQNDVFNIAWDEDSDCLFVSYGDTYGDPLTNDCLVAIDLEQNPPRVLGPWRFGDLGSEYSQRWGYSQCVRAPRSLERFGIHYLASGKDNNTFQAGSWGPGLLGVDPIDPYTTPPHDVLEARQLMFWPSKKVPVTLDTGKVKTGYLTSDMLREHPHWIIAGNSGYTLGGAPEWKDVPYGIAALEAAGWSNGDDAGYFVAVDEPTRQGVLFFGNVTFGAEWYGTPIEFADEHTPDASSPTTWRSWSGIDHPKTDRYLRSPIFGPDADNPKAYVFARQGGGKGNRNELKVHGVWVYAFCDLQLAALGAYEPREGLTSMNVDYTAFHVLASPLALPHVRPITPDLQYESRVNASPTTEVAYIPRVTGAHYRPSEDGRCGRIYVRMSSVLGVETDAVNVWDVQPPDMK
jgi:hypothetical protein